MTGLQDNVHQSLEGRWNPMEVERENPVLTVAAGVAKSCYGFGGQCYLPVAPRSKVKMNLTFHNLSTKSSTRGKRVSVELRHLVKSVEIITQAETPRRSWVPDNGAGGFIENVIKEHPLQFKLQEPCIFAP